ncbi:MAG: bifunctional (p)ppGpp synthetase/guanosine-3',5'-bis(diphosphate) 3'-pyrophosphohydrolase [Myxococcota bacterium]|nr:bifunctional (p)ppGpp synthetase/guanosine-3',5'-bis(diphosphate) 3'-pyrophosphohydrolase [Myxococcota bacterium]
MSTSRRFEDIVEALEEYHPSPNIDLIEKAYMYSAKVHSGQVRKSGEPYLVHPLEVAYLLTKLRLDEASVATGLLHDTVEDTLATVDEIKELFGEEVANLVDGVTKLSQIRFDNDEHKQAENFRKMLIAMAKDIRVILVKLADRLHNMSTLEHLPPAKQQRIARETIDIYAPLANRLGVFWVKSQLEDYAFRFLYPQDHAHLNSLVENLTQQREQYVSDVIHLLQDELSKQNIQNVDVHGRPKHLYSIFKKMSARQIAFEDIYDVIAFRVLGDSVSQCYEVLGHVHSLWHPIPGRFKDYIAMPKPNRYQSLHTSVVGPEGERIEIQIRTREMHKINEEGIAAHWQYKEKGDVDEKNKKKFAWLRQLLELQQDLRDPNEFLDTVKYDLFVDEVFVFTPRGQVISLTRGATPVDFAFSIHTEVGNHCAGAKVNGRMVPLRTELKNGDMVEIITNPQQRPSKDWLAFAATGRARQKIRNYVRTEERARSSELGQELLEREAKRYGLSLQQLIKKGELARIASESRYSTVEGVFVALGYGRTTAAQIIERLVPAKLEKETSNAEILADVVKTKPAPRRKRSSGGVVVQGIDDVLVRFGKCCSPLPGDHIIGFVTRGRGITVHATGCTRAIDADPERRIDVDWDDNTSVLRPVSIRVITTDRPGILANISQAFTDSGVNISQANCKVNSATKAVNTFEVLIKDSEQLNRILNHIRSLKGVVAVDRL